MDFSTFFCAFSLLSSSPYPAIPNTVHLPLQALQPLQPLILIPPSHSLIRKSVNPLTIGAICAIGATTIIPDSPFAPTGLMGVTAPTVPTGFTGVIALTPPKNHFNSSFFQIPLTLSLLLGMGAHFP